MCRELTSTMIVRVVLGMEFKAVAFFSLSVRESYTADNMYTLPLG